MYEQDLGQPMNAARRARFVAAGVRFPACRDPLVTALCVPMQIGNAAAAEIPLAAISAAALS